jgi:hypothetical protein
MAKKTNTTLAAEAASTPDVSFVFVQRESVPERLVCEAELVFNSGSLAGVKLVGFSLWKRPEGEVYVTFPSRAFGAGSERRFFDFPRSVDAEAAPVKALKQAIVEAYKSQPVPSSRLLRPQLDVRRHSRQLD